MRARNRRRNLINWLALLGITGLLGCESVMETGSGFGRTATADVDPADQRLLYKTDGDAQALRWLLHNEVKQGMPVATVNQVLGEDGVRQYDAGWVKNNGSFRIDDDVYKWGPDADGQAIYLVFRNGNLTNYDASQFE
jgi:hypothetical protein